MSTEINFETEIWKQIRNYEECYEISNLGRVKSLYKNPFLILKQSNRGEYLCVSLHKDLKRKTHNVHSLVANTFLDKPDDSKFVVNHKDGNKFNNKVENLEWISIKENNKHARDTKLNIPKTIKVSQYTKDGKSLIQTFNSIKEAMEKTGCSDSKISTVCKGKRNHTGGYFWKYTDFKYKSTEEPEGKSLNEYENYIITCDGKVYSKSYKKYLSKRENSGYEYITLYNDSKKGKDFSIHYLVGKCHIPNPHEYPMLNHKNHIRNDNRIENLEWTTYSENMIEFGKKNGISVNKLDKSNNILQIYDSIKCASKENNISASNITNVCKGRQKSAGGFKWEYKTKELASSV